MYESIYKNRKGIFLMILSSICACIGQLFFKMAVLRAGFFIVFGFAFYGLGALLMIIAYRYGKLSVLQPVLSINYILSLILGSAVFNEKITLEKCIGVIVVVTGVVLIAGGDTE